MRLMMKAKQTTLFVKPHVRRSPSGKAVQVQGHTRHLLGRDATYYASGANHPGEILGYEDAGHALGVSAREVNDRAIEKLATASVPVFVDSGAFGEIDRTGKVIKPMTAADWEHVFDVYDRVIGDGKGDVTVVAPDRVGDQEHTLALLAKYAPRVKALAADGARVLVPMQRGAMSLAEFYDAVGSILGDAWVPAFPSSKLAAPQDQVLELLRTRDVKDLHLLGRGPRRPTTKKVVDEITEVAPDARITMDSNFMLANVEKGRVGTQEAAWADEPGRTTEERKRDQVKFTVARRLHPLGRKGPPQYVHAGEVEPAEAEAAGLKRYALPSMYGPMDVWMPPQHWERIMQGERPIRTQLRILVKAQQLGLFSGGTTQVKAHVRHTPTKAVVVKQHVRKAPTPQMVEKPPGFTHLWTQIADDEWQIRTKHGTYRVRPATGPHSTGRYVAEFRSDGKARFRRISGTPRRTPDEAAKDASSASNLFGIYDKGAGQSYIDQVEQGFFYEVGPGADPAKAPPPKQRIVVKARTPDADTPLPDKEAAKLAKTARKRGEKLIEKWTPSMNEFGNENTARRARMGNNRRAGASMKVALGKRLVRFAEAIEGGYRPTQFDKAMMSERERVNAWWAWRHEGLDPSYTNGYGERYPASAPDMGLPAIRLEYAGYNPSPEKAKAVDQMNQIAQAITGGMGDETWGRFKVTPTTVRLVEQWSELKKQIGDDTDLLAEVKGHQTIGWTRPEDRPEVARRYAAWRDLTDPGKVKVAARPYEQAPDRSGARDPFEERMKRAEADEARRYIPPELKGAGLDFFETPAPLAEQVIELADVQPGMTVLEPSAGRGGIADRLPGDVEITVAEMSPTLRTALQSKGYDRVFSDALEVPGQFDRVVMNPPFSKGLDMEHVAHALEHNVKPGGKLVAIMSPAVTFREDSKTQAFRSMLGEQATYSITPVEAGTFKRSGTGVASVILEVEKPA